MGSLRGKIFYRGSHPAVFWQWLPAVISCKSGAGQAFPVQERRAEAFPFQDAVSRDVPK